MSRTRLPMLLFLCAGLLPAPASLGAQEMPAMDGYLIVNDDLSDDTDRQVEAALRAAGERVGRRLFDFRRDRYRGGPAEQELYDRISYDRELRIDLSGETWEFTYADGFRRTVYTDGRERSVSLSALDELEDFSQGHADGDRLLVEARPRDGGFTEESYTLSEGGRRLRVELYIKPQNFAVPIELTRVYDRATTP